MVHNQEEIENCRSTGEETDVLLGRNEIIK